MHAGISRLRCGLLMWWCGLGQARMWCHGASPSCSLTSLIWAGDARLENAQFLIRCKRSLSLFALPYVSPFTLSLLLLSPPPSQSPPPHAGLFSVNESLLDPLRPASVSPGRSGLPNSTITHSIAQSGVSVPRASRLFEVNVGLLVLMGMDWFCVVSSELTLLLFRDYLWYLFRENRRQEPFIHWKPGLWHCKKCKKKYIYKTLDILFNTL